MRSLPEPARSGGSADDESRPLWPSLPHASRFLQLADGIGQGETRPLVMIVDDDPSTGEMYGAGLEMAGFEVIVLSDVSAIFEAIELDIPDFVVLDFVLGEMITGVNVLENLRLDSRMAEVPVFILSNHLGESDGQIDRAFAAGAMAWLVKYKTSPAELAVRISQALANDAADGQNGGSPGYDRDSGVPA
jgi:DNA-binding response OmpR family regulator